MRNTLTTLSRWNRVLAASLVIIVTVVVVSAALYATSLSPPEGGAATPSSVEDGHLDVANFPQDGDTSYRVIGVDFAQKRIPSDVASSNVVTQTADSNSSCLLDLCAIATWNWSASTLPWTASFGTGLFAVIVAMASSYVLFGRLGTRTVSCSRMAKNSSSCKNRRVLFARPRGTRAILAGIVALSSHAYLRARSTALSSA